MEKKDGEHLKRLDGRVISIKEVSSSILDFDSDPKGMERIENPSVGYSTTDFEVTVYRSGEFCY